MRVLGLALAGALVLTARLGSRLVRWDQDGARRCGSGARHCVSMGWQWSELASGAYWMAQWVAPGTQTLASVERRMGFASLGSERFSRRVGLLSGAVGADVLGLGSERRGV